MTTYQPYFINAKTGVPSVDASYPSMRSAQARAYDLVRDGLAEREGITFRGSHGVEFSVDEIEKILADNEVEFEAIP